jgi:hypothetical protein
MKGSGKKMTPVLFLTSLYVKRGKVFICQFYVHLFMNEKKAVLYTVQNIHSKGRVHIKIYRGLTDALCIHTLPRWGKSTANVDLSRAQMQGFTKRNQPYIPGQIFFNVVSPVKPAPFFIIIAFVPVMKKRLKKQEYS